MTLRFIALLLAVLFASVFAITVEVALATKVELGPGWYLVGPIV